MKVYLDTSSIRKNSNQLNTFKDTDCFTSSFTVFELISGIKEDDFLLRKNAIKNLLNSSICIDWKTYKDKMYDAFGQPCNDIEGIVIKKMAESIIECDTFQEYYKKKIYIDADTYYTHESFEDFDVEISSIGKIFSEIGKCEWRELDKIDRKSLKENMIEKELIFPYVQKLTELSLINLAEDISGHKRPSEEYFNAIEKYNQSLEVYLRYMHFLFLTREMNGSVCGKNDMADIVHLIYLHEDDVIITEDKIFQELNNILQLIKVYNSEEFTNKI